MSWHARRATLLGVGLCAIGLLATIVRPRPLLVWNATPSSPIGLYAVDPAQPAAGEAAVAWAPAAARRLAATRHYLPYEVPLVKDVAASAGTLVCARGPLILVDGRVAALRAARDPSGRAMPWWSGCRRLRAGELFLISSGVRNAFDGRYFGITRSGELIGRARLVWPG